MARHERLKLLLVLDSVYPSIGGGGAEAQVRTLARAFKQGGATVSIVVPMLDEGPQQAHALIDDVPVYRIPYPRIRVLGGIVLNLRLYSYLFRQRRQYDVIHAHIAHHMAAACCLAGSMLGKPVFVKLTGWLEMTQGILHTATAASFKGRWMRRQFLKAYRFQALSSEIVSRLEEFDYPEEKILRLPNAVDTEKYRPETLAERKSLRQKNGRDCDRLVVFVGRLVPEKSLDLLLQAWADVAGTYKARLVLVGEGEEDAALKTLASALGISEQVEFIGPSDDVIHYLRQADIGVLPSAYEGLSNTLLEYMATGLALLGSDVSGTQDMIEHGVSGYLFPAGEREQLGERLQRMLAHDDSTLQAMGEAARQRVLDYAGIEKITEELASHYDAARGAI
jgi:glycosyltransferase involved in cell wall biosynthesis